MVNNFFKYDRMEECFQILERNSQLYISMHASLYVYTAEYILKSTSISPHYLEPIIGLRL